MLEDYPVDTGDKRRDPISAFVGTRRMLEMAGYTGASRYRLNSP